MTEDRSNQDNARMIAADAFRYVAPSPDQRAPFRRLNVTPEERKSVDDARKALQERLRQRFPGILPR